MAKIVGFDQKVADNAGEVKRVAQRSASLLYAGRNIHFVKGYKLSHKMRTV